MGKLIVVEGTDCSGKETQTNLLIERLKLEKQKIVKYGFPAYETPTGKIVGGPYLGKKHIMEGFFEEGAPNVDPKIASAYYAADRRYSLPKILEYLNNGYDVLLDRYVGSNMAHQGGKLHSSEDRKNLFKWLETLEYGLFELPKPDLTIFLYMPYQYALELKKNRKEEPDQHEADEKHLIDAENTYLELAELYNFIRIDCVVNGRIKTREEIHEEVYALVKRREF